jgi:hypothetical protein
MGYRRVAADWQMERLSQSWLTVDRVCKLPQPISNGDPMAKAKKSKAKKSKVKKAKASRVKPAKKKIKKAAKRAAAKAPAKTKKSKRPAAKAKKATRKAAPKKSAPKKKKQIVGEGDYAASRAFDKDQTNFVKRNKAKIPALGKAAEAALDGPEGDSLRAAEQEAMNRSLID